MQIFDLKHLKQAVSLKSNDELLLVRSQRYLIKQGQRQVHIRTISQWFSLINKLRIVYIHIVHKLRLTGDIKIKLLNFHLIFH